MKSGEPMGENEDTEMPTNLGSKGMDLVGIVKYLKKFWNRKGKFTRVSCIPINKFKSNLSRVKKGYQVGPAFPSKIPV